MRLFTTGIALLALLCFAACKKDAGPGGLASIKGKVYGTDVTTAGNIKSQGYIGDQRVFIGVSNDPYSFEDVRTSYDGSYEFRFLRKGTYDVWAYSDCDTCVQKQKLVIKKGIEISDKKETVMVEDLQIIY
jgi:hypothetical protein